METSDLNLYVPLEKYRLSVNALHKHLAERASQAVRSELINQSLNEMLTEFKQGRGEKFSG